ncbi:MAG TPA: efflux RND transporter periplasmic adaptor subunit [Steroidobacteraceae bacterium]|jgi:membrane fusion protein (multidrug efflux system)
MRLDTEASIGHTVFVLHRSVIPSRRLRGASQFAVLAMLASAAACGGKTAAPPAPQPVSTLTMRPQPTSLTQEYPAQLEASNTVEIRPQVGGILFRQAAVEGTPVKRGEMLFEIDPRPYIAALAQAQAGLAQSHAAQAQAVRDLARARPLTEIDALSQRELDAAVAANASSQAQVKAAEAAVNTAELNLGYTQVRSPIDGVMSRALIRIGGVVTAYTTLLTTVYQTDPMYANFSVGEQRMLQVQRELGRPLDQHNPSQRQFRILLADGSEYEFPGTMNFVDAAVDLRTDTLALRLTVSNPKQFLHAGQYVRVVVATRERPNALLLPQRAVQLLQDKNYVWIVDSAGTARQRDVKMGQQQGSDWVVDEGLAPGDVVVVDGAQKLKVGTPVQVQPLAAPVAGPRAS